jgi:hypothetical protein
MDSTRRFYRVYSELLSVCRRQCRSCNVQLLWRITCISFASSFQTYLITRVVCMLIFT